MMSKQTLRLSRYYTFICASGVTCYVVCFLFLWNKAITISNTHSHSVLKYWSEKDLDFHNLSKVGFEKSTHNMLLEFMKIYKNQSRYSTDTSPTNQSSRYTSGMASVHSNRNESKGIHLDNNRLKLNSKRFFISSVIMVRIYKNDLAKWTIKELKQWMHYLFYAGIEHVYLCDHYIYDHERLQTSLRKYVEKGLLTYIEWPWNSSVNAGKIMRHQVNCYNHVISTFGHMSEWQLTIDMDEYPFCLKDTDKLFLSRYLAHQPTNISQIVMPNFLMLGQGDRSKTMVIERITRITKKPANALTKPIYRTSAILHADIHRHTMKTGSTINPSSAELRMLHYWGARTQNWGPDTNKTIEISEEFLLVRENIAPTIRDNLIFSGEISAFSNSTGP